MSAATLKPARHSNITDRSQFRIPRSHERGHIEAYTASSTVYERGGFRAHMSAATLKRVFEAESPEKAEERFRAHMSAATLKPVTSASHSGVAAHDSALT